MEFIEYYQIIRRRIWVIVVLTVVTSAIVVGARLMPQEIQYPASGRVLVHDIAQRKVALSGNEAVIGVPEDATFWDDLNQVLFSRMVMEAAAQEIGLAPGEAGEQLQSPRAQRIENSNAAVVQVSATGVPEALLARDISNARDMAVRYCDAVMGTLDDIWRQRRMAELQSAREALEQRQPDLEREIARLQVRADELARKYDGIPPTGVLEQLYTELTEMEQELAGGEVERGAAEARSQTLSSQAGEIATRRTPANRQLVVDPRVEALRQTILEKQIELDEQLTQRTEEHEEVQVLRKTIQRLEERLEELAAESSSGAVGPEVSAILLQTQITADVESAALTRRIELLKQRAGEIRSKLPDVRADARLYEEIDARLSATQASLDMIFDSLDRLDAEENAVTSAAMFEVLTTAEPGHVSRGLASFAVKLVGAAAAGAAIGVLLILVLHYVDFSFQDEHEAEQMLGVPVLVGIPRSDIVIAPEAAVPDERTPSDRSDDGPLNEPEA